MSQQQQQQQQMPMFYNGAQQMPPPQQLPPQHMIFGAPPPVSSPPPLPHRQSSNAEVGVLQSAVRESLSSPNTGGSSSGDASNEGPGVFIPTREFVYAYTRPNQPLETQVVGYNVRFDDTGIQRSVDTTADIIAYALHDGRLRVLVGGRKGLLSGWSVKPTRLVDVAIAADGFIGAVNNTGDVIVWKLLNYTDATEELKVETVCTIPSSTDDDGKNVDDGDNNNANGTLAFQWQLPSTPRVFGVLRNTAIYVYTLDNIDTPFVCVRAPARLHDFCFSSDGAFVYGVSASAVYAWPMVSEANDDNHGRVTLELSHVDDDECTPRICAAANGVIVCQESSLSLFDMRNGQGASATIRFKDMVLKPSVRVDGDYCFVSASHTQSQSECIVCVHIRGDRFDYATALHVSTVMSSLSSVRSTDDTIILYTRTPKCLTCIRIPYAELYTRFDDSALVNTAAREAVVKLDISSVNAKDDGKSSDVGTPKRVGERGSPVNAASPSPPPPQQQQQQPSVKILKRQPKATASDDIPAVVPALPPNMPIQAVYPVSTASAPVVASPSTATATTPTTTTRKPKKDVEATLLNRLDSLFHKHFKRMHTQIERERAEMLAAERERMMALLDSISATINQQMSERVATSIRDAVHEDIIPHMTQWMTQSLQTTVNRVIVPRLDRLNAGSGDVSKQIRDAFRDAFRDVLVPSFEKSTRSMFQQIHATLEAGVNKATNDQKLERILQTLQRLDERSVMVASPLAPATPTVNQRAVIVGMIERGLVEEPLSKALESCDLGLLVEVCRLLPEDALVNNEMHSASLLSLIQQLAFSLDSDASLKLAWIREAMLALDTTDPVISAHVPAIYCEVNENINKFTVNTPPKARGDDWQNARFVTRMTQQYAK